MSSDRYIPYPTTLVCWDILPNEAFLEKLFEDMVRKYEDSRLRKISRVVETLKGKLIVKCFKRSGLYNGDESAVEHRRIITERDIGDVTQISTSNATENLPEKEFTSRIFFPFIISSPYKDLKYAILQTNSR